MNHVALQTEQLTRPFGAVHAVDDLSLTVPAGMVFGFLGTNGAGKSTTIRLALGLLAPTSGHIAAFGHPLPAAGQAVREQSGALLEHTGLYERLSALDNLDFYGRMWHMRAADRTARAQELLTHFGLQFVPWSVQAEVLNTLSGLDAYRNAGGRAGAGGAQRRAHCHCAGPLPPRPADPRLTSLQCDASNAKGAEL